MISRYCFSRIRVIFLTLLFSLLQVLFQSHGSAEATPLGCDTFDSDTEGWSGTGVTENNQRLRIARDSLATKNYDFSSIGSNRDIIISFDYEVTGGWETSGGSQDYIRMRTNGTQQFSNSPANGTYADAFTASTDSSGQLSFTIEVDTTADGEVAFFDNICFTAITSCPDDSRYTLIFEDDFNDGDRNGWTPIEFDYNISNYPGETVTDNNQTSANEWQNNWTVRSGQLWWNFNGSSGSADEYGMLSYDLSSTHSVSSIFEYSIQVSVNGYPDDPQNNDVGIVFGYVDDRNYYVLRWTQIGSSYISSSMPGIHRRLTLAQVSAGNAIILGTHDNFYDNGDFQLKISSRPDGIIACVDGNTLIDYRGGAGPALQRFGLYSFDNDNGVSYDNVEVRANILKCFNDDFNRTTLGGDWAVSHVRGNFGDPRIVNGRLRLTSAANNLSTAATLLRLFPGASNRMVYEFDHFAYSGDGADGIAVTLSDASVTPVPGGYGGSLGYAQRNGVDGFAGGWLGVGIDEYGNFRNDGEGRGDGGDPRGRVRDSVSVRGSGERRTGYLLHAENGPLVPPVDSPGSSTPAFGHRYRITVDHSNNINAFVTVERDVGSGFQSIIPTYDAKAQTGQAAVPTNWLLSMTGSTGGDNNVHEIDNLEVCATSILPYNEIDHYRISHDGSALTCSPENIQVRACLDADCTVEFAGNVQATFSPSGWVGGNVQTFLSGDTLQLWYTTAGTATLGVIGNSSEFQATNPPRCFIGATEQTDCTLQFYDSGFLFDIPDHISDVTQNITLAAVRKDATTERCVPGFQNVDKDVSFWSDYLDPGSGTLQVRLNTNPIPTVTPTSTIRLRFNNNGETIIDVAYGDVGQMRLNARYEGSGDDAGLIMEGRDMFISRPAYFQLTIPDNPGASDAGGLVFTKAGADFAVEVSARNSNGNRTPNYGKEATSESVRLIQSLVEPVGQNNPTLKGKFDSFGTDCDGNPVSGYACGLFSWEEVGIIELQPEVADGSYLGAGNTTGNSSGNVGRFIPDHFDISTNSPMFSHGCPSGNFTYMGQEFGFLVDPLLTVTAYGVSGSVTGNYGNTFWKYDGSLTARDYTHTGSEPVTLTFSTSGTPLLTGDDDYDGSGEIEIIGDRLTYQKQNPPVGPFVSRADLVLTAADLTDSDGVCYDSDGNGTCESYTIANIGDTEQRHGRLLLQNAFGPETLPLTIPVFTEYFNGTSFVLNNADGCTSYSAVNVGLDNFQPNLNSGDTSASGGGFLIDGLSNDLLLGAPGEGNHGSAEVSLDLSAERLGWLRYDWDGDSNEDDPTAQATFGIFKGNQRLIYMRESVW